MIKTLTNVDCADYNIPFISSWGDMFVLREYHLNDKDTCNLCSFRHSKHECSSSPSCRSGYFEEVDKLTQACIMDTYTSLGETK